MKRQVLTFRPGKELFIHTPLGLITLRRWQDDPRKVEFEMPECMTAFLGNKKDLKEFDLVSTKEGKVVPTFDLATPVVGEDGELVGLVVPRVFTLVEKENNDAKGLDGHTVADSQGGNGG